MIKHAVVAVVNCRDKILLGKKRKDSPKFLAGEWHIPGETVEDGESDQEALIRGIKEETGLDIQVGNYLASHVSPRGKRVNWYECRTQNNEIFPGSDLVEVRWATKEEAVELCRYVADLWPQEIKKYFNLI